MNYWQKMKELCSSLSAVALISFSCFIYLFIEQITCQAQIFMWVCSDEQNRYSTYPFIVSLKAGEWDPDNDTYHTRTLGTDPDTYIFYSIYSS